MDTNLRSVDNKTAYKSSFQADRSLTSGPRLDSSGRCHGVLACTLDADFMNSRLNLSPFAGRNYLQEPIGYLVPNSRLCLGTAWLPQPFTETNYDPIPYLERPDREPLPRPAVSARDSG